MNVKRLKVVHLVRTLDIGGLEKLVIAMARTQIAQSMAVQIWCIEKRGHLADSAEQFGVPVKCLNKGPKLRLKCAYDLLRGFREHGIHVLHSHNKSALLYGQIPGWLTRVPVRVHTQHGTGRSSFEGLSWWGRYALSCADTVVAVSSEMGELYRRVHRLKPSNVQVISNGVAVSEFSPHTARRNNGRVKVIFVGRLVPEKNLSKLLAAIAILRRSAPNFSLQIVGDGPEGPRLKSEATTLGVSDITEFMGARDDIPELLRQADIFVLPSIKEAMPVTILEAMACDLPIVASRVGGIPDVVQESVTGVLVDPNDENEIANALGPLVVAGELRRGLGSAGRRRVETRYGIETCASRYNELYREILESKHRRLSTYSGQLARTASGRAS